MTYPAGWPRCVWCGDFALDGHVTCGRAACSESRARDRRARRPPARVVPAPPAADRADDARRWTALREQLFRLMAERWNAVRPDAYGKMDGGRVEDTRPANGEGVDG